MGRKPKFSKALKIEACEAYKAGNGSFASIANSIGCSWSVLRGWYYTYLEFGDEAFDYSSKNRTYTKEFKLSVIYEYLQGNCSLLDLSAKNNISVEVVRSWINKYNDGIEIEGYDPKGEIYTMENRRTTYKERLDIVEWVIKHDLDYKNAADKFCIKYATIYQWTKKYLDNGPGALEYKKRGAKHKSVIDENQLTEVERLKIELEREKKFRERAELELKILKKKEELERKLHTRK